MNYTENYHLPQWEETDRIMRVDFNQMCADMEAGLTANAEDTARVEEKVDTPWFATGTYNGSNSAVTIHTGFRPRFILIAAYPIPGSDSSSYLASVTAYPENGDFRTVSTTDDGFIVMAPQYEYPNVNRLSRDYIYIAFR